MNRNETNIDSLRRVADWLEEADLPEGVNISLATILVFTSTKEQFTGCVKALGSCVKSSSNDYLNAQKSFGSQKVEVTIKQESACKRVKVGTKVVPAREARTIEVAATLEKVEDVYEWECPDSFLKGGE